MEFSVKTINSFIGLVLVAFLVNYVTIYKFGEKREIKTASSYVNVNTVDKTLDCMAINIYREGANESFEGKVAIAQVTLNRMNNPNFPKDICGVVYQKNVIMEKVICQFSWYCNSSHKNKKIDEKLYNESYAVAKKVLLEGFRLDMLKDALYYHAVYINPGWRHEKIGKVGNHIFYRNKKHA
jgi:spore germination cell wall hydrolase CwlJ-like protein